MRIVFSVNGTPWALDAPPLRRLLDILREDLGLMGTKEGCGEGECGACAVLMNGVLVNSCLVPALQLQGARITTIEGLGTVSAPDPVEQAFLDEGAVQCGFCFPGMVMAARSLLDRNPSPSRDEIRAGLAGNLCRCTGYERIVRAVERAAAEQTAGVRPMGVRPTAEEGVAAAPKGAEQPADPSAHVDRAAFAPATLPEALAILHDRGDNVRIVAGATDLLAAARNTPSDPRPPLDVSRLPDLQGIMRRDGVVEIGAGVTLGRLVADPIVRDSFPALARASELFGAVAIRSRATLGGNLMTASPAADSPPVLAALDSIAVLASSAGRREVPIRSFFPAYRKTAARSDEILLRVVVPVPPEGTRQAFHKVGTRRAQSIAKVSLACRARLDDAGVLRDVRLVAGSVAPTVFILKETEKLLEGQKISPDLIREAVDTATREVRPIDDVRSTESYRRTIAGRLVGRFLQGFAAP